MSGAEELGQSNQQLVDDNGAITNSKPWNLKNLMIFRSPLAIPTLHVQSPYLLSLTRDGTCKFLNHNHTFDLEFPELTDSWIRFSKFGWLLLSRIDGSSFFFNPWTRNMKNLPICSESFLNLCFSSPPTDDSDCYVFGMNSYGFGLIRYGESEWSFYSSYDSFLPCYSHPVYHNDCFYLLGSQGKVLQFDIQKKSSYVFGVTIKGYNNKSFLMENAGDKDLLAVFVSDDEERIRVNRIIPGKKAWRNVKNLRDNMLFVSRTSSCLLKPAGSVEAMSNKIFFPKVGDDNHQLIFYSLGAKKYQSFPGDYSSHATSWNVKEFLNCTWFETAAAEC